MPALAACARRRRHGTSQFGVGTDRVNLVQGFGEAYPIPDDQVPQEWKDINTQKRD